MAPPAAPQTPPVDTIKALQGNVKALGDQVGALTKSFGDYIERAKKTPMTGVPPLHQVIGVPNIRDGENIMSSRGFSFMKMLGVLTGAVSPEEAKIEGDIHARLHNCYYKDMGTGERYNYNGPGVPGQHRFLAPLSPAFMQEGVVPSDFRREMKALVHAGTDGADLDHAKWIRQKQYKSMGYDTKTLSWLNETLGGSLVPPAEQGELIELLRNKEALVNAGARVVPLPAQGRLKYPRQTGASLTYWVGENAPITSSDIQTGEITLQAKKLAVLIKAPNELIRFASPAAEALMRDDMTKSLALGLDLAGLEGVGTDNMPRGITLMQNINRLTSSQPNTNGDSIVGQDIYRMVAAVEESLGEFETFIMRPKTLYKYYQLRFDAVAQNDSRGGFLFSLIREAGEGVQAALAGFPVVKSTQISQSRGKGTATNLTYILGGQFSDLLIGMFGAIEFAATTLGDTPFVNDQTWVRGILSADIQARHEAVFVLMDNLDTTI